MTNTDSFGVHLAAGHACQHDAALGGAYGLVVMYDAAVSDAALAGPSGWDGRGLPGALDQPA